MITNVIIRIFFLKRDDTYNDFFARYFINPALIKKNFFWLFGLYSAILRGYSCTTPRNYSGSTRGTYGMPGIEHRSATCTATPYLLQFLILKSKIEYERKKNKTENRY